MKTIADLTKQELKQLLVDLRARDAFISNSDEIRYTDDALAGQEISTKDNVRWMTSDYFFEKLDFEYNENEEGDFYITVNFKTIDGEYGEIMTSHGGVDKANSIEELIAPFKAAPVCNGYDFFIDLVFQTREMAAYIFMIKDQIKEAA